MTTELPHAADENGDPIEEEEEEEEQPEEEEPEDGDEKGLQQLPP